MGALFNIDENSGAVTFKNEPNYEKPLDKGPDNTYKFKIKVDDGNGGIIHKNIEVEVTDVNDPPVNEIQHRSKGMEEDTTLSIKDIKVLEEDMTSGFSDRLGGALC